MAATRRSTSSPTSAPWRARDRAEAVDVEEHEAERSGLATGTRQLQVEHAVEGAPIRETRQRVGVGESVIPVGALDQCLLESRGTHGGCGQVADGVEAADEIRRLRGVHGLVRQADDEQALDLLGAGPILGHEGNEAHGRDVTAGGCQCDPHVGRHRHDLTPTGEDCGCHRVAGIGRSRDREWRDGLDGQVADAGTATGEEDAMLTIEQVDEAARAVRHGTGRGRQPVELFIERASAGEEPRA